MINNSFWDIGTTGVTKGYGYRGFAQSTFTNLYGGCFASTSCGAITNATNEGAAAKNLALRDTYSTDLGGNS